LRVQITHVRNQRKTADTQAGTQAGTSTQAAASAAGKALRALPRHKRREFKLRIPPAKQAIVLIEAARGKSKSQIAKDCRLDRGTVANILSQSEMVEKIQEGRSRLLGLVPKMVDVVERSLFKDTDRATDSAHTALKGLGVYSPKSEVDLTVHADPYAGRSDDDLEFFSQHGRWPEEKEKE
jgi:hypothetical protein